MLLRLQKNRSNHHQILNVDQRMIPSHCRRPADDQYSQTCHILTEHSPENEVDDFLSANQQTTITFPQKYRLSS